MLWQVMLCFEPASVCRWNCMYPIQSKCNQLYRQRKHRQPLIQAAQAQATSYTGSASTGNQLQRQRSTQQYFVVHSSISQYTVVLRRAQQYLVGQSSTSQYTVVLRSAVVRCSISEHLQFAIRCLAIRNQLPAVCYPQSAIRSQLPAVCYPQSAIPPLRPGGGHFVAFCSWGVFLQQQY